MKSQRGLHQDAGLFIDIPGRDCWKCDCAVESSALRIDNDQLGGTEVPYISMESRPERWQQGRFATACCCLEWSGISDTATALPLYSLWCRNSNSDKTRGCCVLIFDVDVNVDAKINQVLKSMATSSSILRKAIGE
jgi:hypothetical protein